MSDAERSCAGAPDAEIAVPRAVAAVADGRVVRPVWENELGGLTFDVGDGDDRAFVKWSPRGPAPDLGAEAERLRWAARYAVVPAVLALGRDDAGSWLVTTPLRGTSVVSARWVADPETAVAAIGRGLRALHDALPVDACPYSWSVADRTPSAGHAAPPIDRLVVCHGDPCAPNTLVDDDGRFLGHVDFGHMGVADRWADLAVATWSTVWNYGAGYEDLLLAEYGVARDATRTAFYRWLWDVDE